MKEIEQTLKLCDLPNELLFKCFSFLCSPKDLVSLSKTNHQLHELALNNLLWSKFNHVLLKLKPEIIRYNKTGAQSSICALSTSGYLVASETYCTSGLINCVASTNIRIWDTKKFTLKANLKLHDEHDCGITAMISLPNDNFVTAYNNGDIHIWKLIIKKYFKRHKLIIKAEHIKFNFKTLKIFETCCSYIKSGPSKCRSFVTRAIAYLPPNKLVTGGCCHAEINIWDINTGESLRKLTGHDLITNKIAILPNNKIATACRAPLAIVRIWDLSSGNCINELTLKDHIRHTAGVVNSILSLSNGTLAIARSDIVRIWNPEEGILVKKLLMVRRKYCAEKLIEISNGQIVSWSPKHGMIFIWDIKSDKYIIGYYNSNTNNTRDGDLIKLEDGRIICGTTNHFTIFRFPSLPENNLLRLNRNIDTNEINEKKTTDKYKPI